MVGGGGGGWGWGWVGGGVGGGVGGLSMLLLLLQQSSHMSTPVAHCRILPCHSSLKVDGPSCAFLQIVRTLGSTAQDKTRSRTKGRLFQRSLAREGSK